MITKLFFDNIEGINKPIQLDFISKSRGNKNTNTQFKVKDESIYINKIVGLLGGNASGKSSFISAISLFRILVDKPILDNKLKMEILDFKNNISLLSEDEQEYKLEKMREQVLSTIDVSFQNVSRKGDDSIFEIELYSDFINGLEGFYSYRLEVNGRDGIIRKEIFSYRKKYKSKEKILIDAENLTQSQIGYLYNSHMNLESLVSNLNANMNDKISDIIKYIIVFKDEFDRSISIFNDIDYSLTFKDKVNTGAIVSLYNRYPDKFKKLVSIVDDRIIDVRVNQNNTNKEIQFYINDKDYLFVSQLSKGTQRLLVSMNRMLRQIDEQYKTVNNYQVKTGIIVIDEIEQNVHIDLVKLIIGLFSDTNNKHRQLIFTTLDPDILDLKNEDGKNYIKQDAIYIFNRDKNKNMILERLNEINMEDRKNGRVSGDAVLGNLYRSKKLSFQPDSNKVNDFIKCYNK